MSNYQLCDTYIDTILAIFGNNIWIDKNVRSRRRLSDTILFHYPKGYKASFYTREFVAESSAANITFGTSAEIKKKAY